MSSTRSNSLDIAVAGDAYITRKLPETNTERIAKVFEKIRAADAGIVNLEVLVHNYEGYPAASSGGIHSRAPPFVLDELQKVGFDLFSTATNHAGDYSHGGMEATMRELERRGVPHAGLGRTLATAREPVYFESPAGRIGLVAATTAYPASSVAGPQSPDMQGRPGIAPLKLHPEYSLPPDAIESLKQLSEDLGLESIKTDFQERGLSPPGDDDTFTFINVGDGPHLEFTSSAECGVSVTPDETHKREIEKRVAEASKQADWVVVSIHSHQGANGSWNDHSIPRCLPEVARDVIELGADVFMAHGSHLVKGIEIFDGSPIFYGLGNFVFENESITRLPAEDYLDRGLEPDGLPSKVYDERTSNGDERSGFMAYRGFWESFVPICHFEKSSISSIDVIPIELGYEQPRSTRGRPMMAEDDRAAAILSQLESLSEQFGTEIAIDGSTGRIECGHSQAT